MDEVSVIDLDLGTCQPPPGSPSDDARLLPWADRLQAALQVTTWNPCHLATSSVNACTHGSFVFSVAAHKKSQRQNRSIIC